MKDIFIDIMVTMMPIMKPFMWFSAAVAIIGFIFIVAKIAFKIDTSKVTVWSGRIVILSAVFFLAAQLAGHLLSMPPTINFGDSSKFEFILVSFWQIGVVFLVSGLGIKFLASASKAQNS